MVIASMVCALYSPWMFCFDILMDFNDFSVWLPIVGQKYQSFFLVVQWLLASMWFLDSLLEPMWVALFGPTGGCLGSCDGCHAGGLHTGRPSSAHSVTPLTTLLSLSDPVTKTGSDRYRQERNRARDKREWVAHPFRYRHSWNPR